MTTKNNKLVLQPSYRIRIFSYLIYSVADVLSLYLLLDGIDHKRHMNRVHGRLETTLSIFSRHEYWECTLRFPGRENNRVPAIPHFSVKIDYDT